MSEVAGAGKANGADARAFNGARADFLEGSIKEVAETLEKFQKQMKETRAK